VRSSRVVGFVVASILTSSVALGFTSQAEAAVRLPLPPPSQADGDFANWLTDFHEKAMKAGITQYTFDRSLRWVSPDPKIINADRNQPEFSRPVWAYLDSAVSDARVKNGLAKLGKHRTLLKKLENAYGVDKEVLIAIWGLETGYGAFMGGHYVTRALATLAFEGRRRDFGEEQLIAALKILQNGDTTPDKMRGSWAGAMGHTQFIPTTYQVHAVDFNKDGRRDIWNTIDDALGSAGNYLKASGWDYKERWGYEVTLERGFDYAQASSAVHKPLMQWIELGVERIDNKAFNRRALDQKMRLLMPAGARGPAFLVGSNFKTVLAYNNSTSYSLAVNILADRLRGRPGVLAQWPRTDKQMGRNQREEMQGLLTKLGFDTQGIDGIIGGNTRKALRRFQKSRHIPADGYPSYKMLERLRVD